MWHESVSLSVLCVHLRRPRAAGDVKELLLLHTLYLCVSLLHNRDGVKTFTCAVACQQVYAEAPESV